MELMENLQGFVAENLSLLTPVDQAWQPTDFLPDLTAEDWAEQVTRFRTSAAGLATSCWSCWWATWSRKRPCQVTPSR